MVRYDGLCVWKGGFKTNIGSVAFDVSFVSFVSFYPQALELAPLNMEPGKRPYREL